MEKSGTAESEGLDSLRKKQAELSKCLAAKEEHLRKLKMAKMYREKNNVEELNRLTDKWKGVSQEALLRLHRHAQGSELSLSDLINHMQLDHEMIGYDPQEEAFS